MQIQSIDYNCNFGNISKINAKYSKEQNKVANEIIKLFKEQPKNLSKTSLEKKYERMGYDFFVEPSFDNMVRLKGYIPSGKIGKEIYYQKGSTFNVGEYNKFYLPKDTTDLDKQIQCSKNSSMRSNLIMLAFLAAVGVLLPIAAKKTGTKKVNPKELIENTEQISNKAKVALSDTIDFIQKH